MSVVDRQVRPLYKHLIHTEYQRMAFVGLPTVVLPFPLFHKQVSVTSPFHKQVSVSSPFHKQVGVTSPSTNRSV